jgi:phenylalanyl-tRNA synthetase beta chain
MRIVQSWLRQYTDFRFSPEDLAESLTMLGLEFERIERPGKKYEGFVVGEVLDVQRHPKADRLTVCRVRTGKETLQIVCGAPNVAPGQKVPVGLVGATVPRNQHDPSGKPFVLSQVTLRSVESSGMICSAYELDLGKDAEGILVLDTKAKVGQPLAAFLGMDDVVYDVEITPNRPDWLSHIGIAREIAVLTGKQPRLPKIAVREERESITRHLAVRVEDPELCPRFAVKMIRGVHIGPSPAWLQQWLTLAGLRPRNNVVDITNFVMLESGHPMHAFDYALIEEQRLVIRRAGTGLRFVTLDGKEHDVPSASMMVCDGKKPVSIAGVMGGANSEIRESTADVVLEAAYWNPSSIRRTARTLGISTDASQRFERGADPQAVRFVLDRAAALVAELAGGTILRGAIDIYPKRIRERLVPLRPARANAVLGTTQSAAQMTRALRLLGIRPARRTKDRTLYAVPTFRVDIEREIDLIEEVARVYGYNNIEEKTRTSVDFVQPFPRVSPGDRVRALLTGAGFREVITNSMHDERRAALTGKTPVRILNPQNQDMLMLRTSLLPGMLDVVARNLNSGTEDLRLFEVGHVFSVDQTDRPKLVEQFLEEECLALLLTGKAEPRHWSEKPRPVDFFDIKGEVEALLERFALDKWQLISYPPLGTILENVLAVEIEGRFAGYLGSVREDVLKPLGIEQRVFTAELHVAPLTRRAGRIFEPLPKYPKVRRDVAFSVSAETTAEVLMQGIRASAGELLQRVELFDMYQGDKLTAGTKSLAFTLELMSRDRTLTDAEIDGVVQKVVRHVERECQATLRGVK